MRLRHPGFMIVTVGKLCARHINDEFNGGLQVCFYTIVIYFSPIDLFIERVPKCSWFHGLVLEFMWIIIFGHCNILTCC